MNTEKTVKAVAPKGAQDAAQCQGEALARMERGGRGTVENERISDVCIVDFEQSMGRRSMAVRESVTNVNAWRKTTREMDLVMKGMNEKQSNSAGLTRPSWTLARLGCAGSAVGEQVARLNAVAAHSGFSDVNAAEDAARSVRLTSR